MITKNVLTVLYCTKKNIKRAANQPINMFFASFLISSWLLRDDYCNPSPPIGINDTQKMNISSDLFLAFTVLLLSVSDPDPHGSALKRPPDPDLHGQMRIRIRPVPEGLEK